MAVDLSKYPFRIQRLMRHTCNLYRPAARTAQTPGGVEAADFSYSATLAYSNVPCYYQATPEFDEPKDQGITKQINILTSDKWHFLAEQEIADTWLIEMTTPDHPYSGRIWTTQGNSTMNASMPGRPTDSQWIYAKLSPTQDKPT